MNHVETVKAMYAAFGRGDLEGILSHLAENVSWEFEAPAELSWGGLRKGPAEAAGFFTNLAATHAEAKLEITDIFGADDAVASFGRYHATVKSSGIRVNSPVGHLFKFDTQGKVVRYVNLVNTATFAEAQSVVAMSGR